MLTLPVPDNKLEYLVGQSEGMGCARPVVPYNDLVCEFLNNLSGLLLANSQAKLLPDVIAFAYWCRTANIKKLKQAHDEKYFRLGLGVVFHITPSNVPINFAFSFVFSLLAGNANIVRVPTKDFPQTGIVCGVINQLLRQQKYKMIAEMTVFIKYPQNDDITRVLSENCNGRIIWGGDQAINSIRKFPIPERGIEVAFADRYSFCVIDATSILQADSSDVERLASGFFNDIFLMDQNACSSPHLIVWLGEGEAINRAKQVFWESVYKTSASKYDLQAVHAVDKYVQLCRNAIEFDNIQAFQKYGNHLYRVELDSLPADIDACRGKYGYIYEFNAQHLNEVAHIINTKYQTLTYFGLDKAQLLDFVLANRLTGIDRIVPIGAALDIGIIWDGYDIVRSLSRIIDFKE